MPSAFGVSWDSLDPRPLGSLMQSYEAGQTRAREDALRQALMGNPTTDYNELVRLAMTTGNVGSLKDLGGVSGLLQNAQDADLIKRGLGALTGDTGLPGTAGRPPGPQSAMPPAPAAGVANLPSPAAPQVAAAVPPAGYTSTGFGGVRPMVPSTPTVVGDREAIDAGLYDPDRPTRVASVPPGTIPVPPGGAEPTPAQTVAARFPGGQGIGGPDVPVNAPLPQPRPPGAPGPIAQAPAPPPPPQQQTQAASLAQVIPLLNAKNVPALMLLASQRSNPHLAVMAQKALEHIYKQTDLSVDEKAYRDDVAQGYKGTRFQWDLERRRAAATLINTAEGAEAKRAQAQFDIDKPLAIKAGEEAAKARRALPILQRFVEIAHTVPGGWAGRVMPAIAQGLSALGYPVSESMTNAELMNAMTRQLIPGVREPGSTTEWEGQQYIAALPNLGNSAEGRVIVAKMLQAQSRRAIEYARIYRDNVGQADLHDKLSALDDKPLLSKAEHILLQKSIPETNPYRAELRRRGLDPDTAKPFEGRD